MPARSRPPRPRAVTVTLVLCSVLAAIGSVQYLYRLVSSDASLAFVVVTGALTIGAPCVLLYGLFAGHGWARSVFLFLLAIEILRLLATLAVSVVTNVWLVPAANSQAIPLSLQLGLAAQIALAVPAFTVLRSQSARDWYRRADR